MLEDKLKALPEQPGVYLMKDIEGKIIYVGKAKVLKNRVKQYFQSSKNHSTKVLAMVSNIADFEYIITNTELEAFVLECSLIKKHKPRYNIMLKDDKNYPYIKVSIKDDYPKIFMTRTMDNDGARYFGPYTSSFLVHEMIDMVNKVFKIPSCNKQFPKDFKKERPCLYHAMGRCLAPCQGNVSQAEFKETFFKICDFLDGKHKKLIDELQKEMFASSDNLEFEKAADLRNQINSIKQIMQKQNVLSDNGRDIDFFAMAADEELASIEVFYVRRGKLTGHENFCFENAMDEAYLMSDFIAQFYIRDIYIPSEIMVSSIPEEKDVLEELLREKKKLKVAIKEPLRGETKVLLDLAMKNAKKAMFDFKEKQLKFKSKQKALIELGEALGLAYAPKRIEAFDISNISGSDNVGAMVVFNDGRPLKSDYRKFKIKTVTGPNDYECTREVLTRRYSRLNSETAAIIDGSLDVDDAKFALVPDVILMDGGKGHVTVAHEVLKELGLDIPVFGMVKDDKHRTRSLIASSGEIELKPTGAAFRLMVTIQDEVHRMAIEYHRSQREKRATKSSLKDIDGVGDERSKKLMLHFKSINKIKTASLEQLQGVSGIDKATALKVFNYFREEK